jgi:hypothetical protein
VEAVGGRFACGRGRAEADGGLGARSEWGPEAEDGPHGRGLGAQVAEGGVGTARSGWILAAGGVFVTAAGESGGRRRPIESVISAGCGGVGVESGSGNALFVGSCGAIFPNEPHWGRAELTRNRSIGRPSLCIPSPKPVQASWGRAYAGGVQAGGEEKANASQYADHSQDLVQTFSSSTDTVGAQT